MEDWYLDLWKGWKMERSVGVQGEGEVPFIGAVVCVILNSQRPRQTFRMVTAGRRFRSVASRFS